MIEKLKQLLSECYLHYKEGMLYPTLKRLEEKEKLKSYLRDSLEGSKGNTIMRPNKVLLSFKNNGRNGTDFKNLSVRSFPNVWTHTKIAADSCSYFVFSFSFASASASFLSKMGVGICMICSKGKLSDLDNFNAVSGDICNGFMALSPIDGY